MIGWCAAKASSSPKLVPVVDPDRRGEARALDLSLERASCGCAAGDDRRDDRNDHE